jgi:hypothetical protein
MGKRSEIYECAMGIGLQCGNPRPYNSPFLSYGNNQKWLLLLVVRKIDEFFGLNWSSVLTANLIASSSCSFKEILLMV